MYLAIPYVPLSEERPSDDIPELNDQCEVPAGAKL